MHTTHKNSHSNWASIILQGNPSLIAECVSWGMDPNAVEEDSAITPLGMAAAAGVPGSITRALLEVGAQTGIGMHPLMICAHTGNTQAAKELLLHNSIFHVIDENGNRPLDVAAENGNAEIAKVLLDHQARIDQPNRMGNTPLMLAARSKQLHMVKFLLARGANPNCQDKKNQFALSAAISGYADKAETEIVQALIHDTRPTLRNNIGSDVLAICVDAGQEEAVRILINKGVKADTENNRGATVLHLAAMRENKEILKLLLSSDVSINKQNMSGDTPLMSACKMQNLENVKALVEQGADIEMANYNQETPLMMAAAQGDVKTFHYLVSKGANRNVMNNEGSLLHYAATGGSDDLTQWLLNQGANMYEKNERGLCPLHIAAEYNCPEVAMILIERGCNPALQDVKGRDIFEIGSEEFSLSMSALLSHHHALVLQGSTKRASAGISNRRI